MAELKLARIPDRKPVKLVIHVMPDLESALVDYAKAYEATYGSAVSPAELIPHMLETFLNSDRGFVRTRRR